MKSALNLSAPLTIIVIVSIIVAFFMILTVLCICGSYIDDKRETRELEEIAERAIRRREYLQREERARHSNGNCYQNGSQIYSIMDENRKNYNKSHSGNNIQTATSKKVKHFQSYRKHKIMQAKMARKSMKQANSNGAANVT